MRGFSSAVKMFLMLAVAFIAIAVVPNGRETRQPPLVSSAPPSPQFTQVDLKKPYFLTLDTIVHITCMVVPDDLLHKDPKTLTKADFERVAVVSGSGTIIAHNRVLTAHHVIDGVTACTIHGVVFKPSKALAYDSADLDITVLDIPLGETPITDIACDGYTPGQTYLSFGYAEAQDFAMDLVTNVGTEDVMSQNDDGKPKKNPHIGVFTGGTTQGMSGGPVIGTDGRVYGINNLGVDRVNGGISGSRSLSDTELCSALKPVQVLPSTATATPGTAGEEAVTTVTK